MSSLTRVRLAALVACVLSLTGSRPASAQPRFELGIRGGIAFTRLTSATPLVGTTELDATYSGTISSSLGDTKVGFVGGAYATAHLTRRFGVRLEALYAEKGTAGKNSGEIILSWVDGARVKGTNTLTLAYVEIPILAVVSFPTAPHEALDLFAGPAVAFRTKAQLHQTVEMSWFDASPVAQRREGLIPIGASGSGSATQDVSDRTADTDVGAVIGVGVSGRRGAVIVSFDARWTQGLLSVDTGGYGAKNHSISLSLGLGVPLGGWE